MRRSGILIPAFLIVVFFAGYVLFPAGAILSAALSGPGGLSLERLTDLFDPSQSANIEAVTNSVLVSVLSVLFSAAIGLSLALLVTQCRFPFRRTVERLAVLPFALPPLVGVIAFLFAFGESGVLPRALQLAFGMDSPPLALDGIPAIVVVHVYSFNVYFYLFAVESLRRLDASVIEAAEGLGARSGRILLGVVFPHLRPAIAGAAALTFMASMASFSAPYLFAGAHRFLSLQIFITKMNGEMELAAAQSALLALLSILFFVLFAATAGAPGRPGKGAPRPGRLRLGRWMTGLLIASGATIVALELLPLLMIFLLAFAKEGSWTRQILPAEYTLDNFLSLARDPAMGAPIVNSVLMAALAVAGCAVIGLAGAYLLDQARKRRTGLVLDIVLTFPFAIPGTVVAIGLILAFNAPGLFSGGRVLVGTLAILPLAYVIRMYPVALRSIAAAFAGIDRSVIEASESLGAPPWTRLRTILLPLLIPGIAAGSLLVGVSALGEFVSSILLYTYDNRPISVEILARLRAFDVGAAAAYSVVLLLLVLVLVWLAGRLSRGSAEGVMGQPR